MKVPATFSFGRSAGITLIELVMTIVILSIAMVVTVSVVAESTRQSADPLIQHRSTLIAQAYLDEIVSKPFADDTPVGGLPASTSASVCVVGAEFGETRDDFDDVDDYDGVSETPPRTLVGSSLPDYPEYQVQIAVSCAGTSLGLTNNYDAKLISITVSPPIGSDIYYASYRGNY